MLDSITVVSEKRQRQKQNKQAKLEEQRQQETKARTKRYIFMGVAAAVILFGVLYLISLLSNNDEVNTTTANESNTTASSETTAESNEKAEAIPCPAKDGSSERKIEFPSAPPDCLDIDANYSATIETNLGNMTLKLDQSMAPNTVNNFVYLARYHYYDGTTFHRVIEDFMIQGGDANGDPKGTGNPGYLIEEEPPKGESPYKRGVLAMAKSAGPKATGAQFFIMTKDNYSLEPEYSVFGELAEGEDTLDKISKVQVGGPEESTPIDEVIIKSIKINEE